MTAQLLLTAFGCAEKQWEQLRPATFCEEVAGEPFDSGQPLEMNLSCAAAPDDCDDPAAVAAVTEGQIWNTWDRLDCFAEGGANKEFAVIGGELKCSDGVRDPEIAVECWLPAD